MQHRGDRSSAICRRQWLRLATAGLVVGTGSGWLKTLSADAASQLDRRRSCILLWMNGGPSQIDTFDMKPDHPNGGEFKPIATTVPGLQISEHLPKLATQAEHLAVIRSMTTKEGDHGRATYLLRTGYAPLGQVQHPALGSLVSKELSDEDAALPGFVSISPFRYYNRAAHGPGFLGSEYAPLVVGEKVLRRAATLDSDPYQAALRIKNLDPPESVGRSRFDERMGVLHRMNEGFANEHPGGPPHGHRLAIDRALRLMRSQGVGAFDIDAESSHLRDAYGRNPFGQGCLLARRLVERGVPFVEITLDSVEGVPVTGWDTHEQNFERVERLSRVLDSAWATLLLDLNQRGLLETTTVVWMGEFGRTPKINKDAGRDHAPNAWTAVLAGGGIRGGQAIGRTSADGTTVEDRPASVPDFFATICHALGIDPRTENVSNVGRRIRIADSEAKPIKEALL